MTLIIKYRPKTNAIKEMILPGLLAVASPVLVGFIFGPETLGGLLAGVTVSGACSGQVSFCF